MGIYCQLVDIRGAIFRSRLKKKQPDTAFRLVTRNGEDDWPTLVFECGVSESLTVFQSI